jgi:hypothetical protein
VGEDVHVNRQVLRELLASELVRPDAFSLTSTHGDECLCLEASVAGWAVFYAERGQRTGERYFETEDEACDFMAARLLADMGNRQPPHEPAH